MSGLKIFIFLVTLFSSAVRAEVYKCLEEDGGITFSQIPCPLTTEELDQLNYTESQNVKSGIKENLEIAEKQRLQKRYRELVDELASLKATQSYAREKGGLGSSATYSAYGSMIRRVETEIERIKYQAKEKGIDLRYDLF